MFNFEGEGTKNPELGRGKHMFIGCTISIWFSCIFIAKLSLNFKFNFG